MKQKAHLIAQQRRRPSVLSFCFGILRIFPCSANAEVPLGGAEYRHLPTQPHQEFHSHAPPVTTDINPRSALTPQLPRGRPPVLGGHVADATLAASPVATIGQLMRTQARAAPHTFVIRQDARRIARSVQGVVPNTSPDQDTLFTFQVRSSRDLTRAPSRDELRTMVRNFGDHGIRLIAVAQDLKIVTFRGPVSGFERVPVRVLSIDSQNTIASGLGTWGSGFGLGLAGVVLGGPVGWAVVGVGLVISGAGTIQIANGIIQGREQPPQAQSPTVTLPEITFQPSPTIPEVDVSSLPDANPTINVESLPDIGGGGGGGGCFTPETLVAVEGGLVPIGQISVGDYVLAKPESGGAAIPRAVEQVFTHDVDEILRLHLADGTSINTTACHPFFLRDVGFVVAGSLAVNDEIEAVENSVRILGKKRITEARIVYNLEVSVDHTFFVGRSGLFVHNAKDLYN